MKCKRSTFCMQPGIFVKLCVCFLSKWLICHYLISTSGSGTEILTLKYVLGEHVKEVMVGQPSDIEVTKNLINVRQNHVFADGIRKIARSNFQASFPLSVKFADELGSSEGAIDLGGPTREFLRLAFQDMFLSNVFAGPANRKAIVLNQEGTV